MIKVLATMGLLSLVGCGLGDDLDADELEKAIRGESKCLFTVDPDRTPRGDVQAPAGEQSGCVEVTYPDRDGNLIVMKACC